MLSQVSDSGLPWPLVYIRKTDGYSGLSAASELRIIYSSAFCLFHLSGFCISSDLSKYPVKDSKRKINMWCRAIVIWYVELIDSILFFSILF